ncbi:MAG: hypothetical protein HY077_10660 [Elusimicrobia bacterium]|nr:hypothetical protein [Elusimicrobiota bacterium]
MNQWTRARWKTIAAALMLGLGVAVSSTEVKAPQLGEGAQRLVGGAVKKGRSRWGPEACVRKVDAHINVSHYSNPPGPKVVYFNEFNFIFSTDEVGRERREVSIIERIGALANPPDLLPYDEYRFPKGYHSAGAAFYYSDGCVREMSVDSGEALALGRKYGLVVNPDHEYHAYLRTAERGGRSFVDAALFGETFWIVGRNGGDFDYFIDAKTGKLLVKKKP